MWTPQLRHHNLPAMSPRLSLPSAKIVAHVAEDFIANKAKKFIEHEADKFVTREVKRIKKYEQDKARARRAHIDARKPTGNDKAVKTILTNDKSKVAFTPVLL